MPIPFNPITVFGQYTGGSPNLPLMKDSTFMQTHDSGQTTEYSSIGPHINEVFTTYSYNQATHHIRFLAFVSPDILVVHQSKVAGFYRVVSANRKLDPIARDVKDQILKDTNMRITSSTTSKALPSGTALLTSSVSGGY